MSICFVVCRPVDVLLALWKHDLSAIYSLDSDL